MKQQLCTIDGCPNKGKYCRLHLGFSVPEKSKIAPVSESKKDLDKQYKKVREKFLSEHKVCMANLLGCQKKANQIHHMVGRASEQDLLNDKYLLAVCFPCHRILETSPAFARQKGFSFSRLSKRQQ